MLPEAKDSFQMMAAPSSTKLSFPRMMTICPEFSSGNSISCHFILFKKSLIKFLIKYDTVLHLWEYAYYSYKL